MTKTKPIGEHIPFVDYLRGVAILSVFSYHSLWHGLGTDKISWIGWFRDWNVGKSLYVVFPATFGQAGIAIFFVISGFCIHYSHKRSRYKGYTVFFLRRFFRIYPPYLLALCIFTSLFALKNVVFHASSQHQATIFDVLYQFIYHFFLVHNFSEKAFFGINGPFWTIAVEVQLYLLYPLLLWLASQIGWQRTLGITAFIEMSCRSLQVFWTIQGYSFWSLPIICIGSPLVFWFSWALGAVLADAYLEGKALPFRNFLNFAWPVLFVGCYLFKPLVPYSFTFAALATTGFMSHCLGRPAPASKPVSKGLGPLLLAHLRWAGIVSYSAYLLHEPLLIHVPAFIAFISNHHAFPPWIEFGFCLCAWFPIFGLSYLYYRKVEQPSIAWGKQVIERLRNSVTPPGPSGVTIG